MILILKNKFFFLVLIPFFLRCFSDNLYVGYKSNLIIALTMGLHRTVVTYGTSLTAGGAWVTILEDALNDKCSGNVTIINSGQSGASSQWGIEHVGDKVISKKPDCVFIEFSINDAVPLFNISEHESEANLCKIIDSITLYNKDCEIILMTMNPRIADGVTIESIGKYYDIYKKVGRERNLMVIDNFEVWKDLRVNNREKYEGYIPDGCHPNTIGNKEIIVTNILKSLQVL